MIIAHLDMDAFFAAVEERENPQFEGWGIVVGADPKNGLGRGVVSTANYQARKYGIHSAQPITVAWRLAKEAERRGEPKTVFLPVNGSYYSQVSDRIFSIVRKYVPAVEQTSIDEAYLDLSNHVESAEVGHGFFAHLPNSPRPFQGLGSNTVGVLKKHDLPADSTSYTKAIELIQKIKAEIKSQEKLTASVGIGPNKLIAKMASARFKPDGLTVVRSDEIEKFLDPLPIGDIPGIGPKSEEFFHKKRIYKISDLKKISREQLVSWMGKWGAGIWEKVRGIDDSKVSSVREIKSISEQETFEKDTISAAFILDRLDKLATGVMERMKSEGIVAFKTVTVVIRFADFTTKNRAHTLKDYSDNLAILKNESIKLILPFLDRRENPQLKKIRLIGVGVESFREKEAKIFNLKFKI